MWREYLTLIVILLAVYYLVLVLLCYKEEVRALLAGKYRKPRRVITWKREEVVAEDRNPFAALETLVEDIRLSILDKAGKEAGKEVLLAKLKERLANYDGLHQPAYRVALNNFIIHQAKELCGVAFSEDELNEAWDGPLR